MYKGVLDLLLRKLAIDEIGAVDITDEVGFEYLPNIRLLMDGEDVPERVNAASSGPQNDLTARVSRNPVGDVVDFVAVRHPGTIGLGAVFSDLRDAKSWQAWVSAVGIGSYGERRMGECGIGAKRTGQVRVS